MNIQLHSTPHKIDDRWSNRRSLEVITPSRKRSSYLGSLDDFLKRFPISTMNEYGDRVIRGIRIC